MKASRMQTSLYPPHIHDWRTVSNTTWISVATLVPVLAWSVYVYRLDALVTCALAIGSAVLSESVVNLVRRSLTLGDGSAVITGAIVALAMPPGVAWYAPVAASVFAVFVVKAAFGGLGSNWMNPALGGIAFAYSNWPEAMHTFSFPASAGVVDAVSGSTPIVFARGLLGTGEPVTTLMQSAGYPVTAFDLGATAWMNDVLFQPLGARLPSGYIDLATGFRAGTIGESAMVMVLAGAAVLFGLRIIRGTAPIAALTVFSGLVWFFGTALPGEQLWHGDVLFALLSGGTLLTALYTMADPVTSPHRTVHAILYGVFTGILFFVFRYFGMQTEGAAFAVLIANIVAPTIDSALLSLARFKAARKSR